MTCRSHLCLAGFICLASFTQAFAVIPTPQYMEPLKDSVALARGVRVSIVIGPAGASENGKLRLAAEFLKHDLLQADSSVRVDVGSQRSAKTEGVSVYLWDYSADQDPPVKLNALDRDTLTSPSHYGQSYVLRTAGPASVWVVGGTDQATLLGVMSLLQLMQTSGTAVGIQGAYIRDYPDFQYRDAANWLMNGEGTRWSLDRGQGIEGYKRVCERKLDDALRYKINMIQFDGFGWSLEQRFKGYGELMRDLNRYARDRGIHLVFGGYGAGYGFAYQTGPLYEAAPYLGKVFENRDSYPNGPIYQCMGFPETKPGVDPSTLGTCRANEELNNLKAEELRKYVEAVEPGALYIHHEDLGDYRETVEVWKKRCQRCRSRWPNNSLEAKDGGAGAFAHGYSALVRAVETVKDPGTGYDAARDCQIVLVSPVYEPTSASSEDWSDVLELWKNVAVQLPEAANLQVCFREVFSQEYGGETWIKAFNSAMAQVHSNLGSYMFFLGGADNYSTGNALTGAPALDAEFFGATTMFNFNGDFFHEPMAVINAEYSWNTHSTGLARKPARNQEIVELWHRYMDEPGQPAAIFGSGGTYERVCNLLYGGQAGPILASYYLENSFVPDGGTDYESRQSDYLPMTFNRAVAIPQHWRDLALDSNTWKSTISNETYAADVAKLKIDPQELHRRLAWRWSVLAALNTVASRDVNEALSASPRPEAVEDLRFLKTLSQVDSVLMNALIDFHTGMRSYFASPRQSDEARMHFQKALAEAQQAQEQAAEAFPHPIDPSGGEVGILRTDTARLVEAIKSMLGQV